MSKQEFQALMDDFESLFNLAKHCRTLKLDPKQYQKVTQRDGYITFEDIRNEIQEMETLFESIKDIANPDSELTDYAEKGLEKLSKMEKECQTYVDNYKKELAGATRISEKEINPTESTTAKDEHPEEIKKRIKERKKKFRKLGNKKGWIPLK